MVATAKPPQPLQRVQTVARFRERLRDTCGLRRGGPFGTPVKQPGLQQFRGQPAMTLAESIDDRLFTAARKLQPRCDLQHESGERSLLLEPGRNFRTGVEVKQRAVCDYASNGLEFDAAIFLNEGEVKGADVSGAPVRTADGRKQCGGG